MGKGRKDVGETRREERSRRHKASTKTLARSSAEEKSAHQPSPKALNITKGAEKAARRKRVIQPLISTLNWCGGGVFIMMGRGYL